MSSVTRALDVTVQNNEFTKTKFYFCSCFQIASLVRHLRYLPFIQQSNDDPSNMLLQNLLYCFYHGKSIQPLSYKDFIIIIMLSKIIHVQKYFSTPVLCVHVLISLET